MTLFASRADFAYGNARLRARKSRLLDRAGYEELLGEDVDGLLGVLASTSYAPEVEGALARFRGIRRVHEAVRLHLARSLEETRSFYEGYARELVDLLLSRWNLHNVIALLRGVAAGRPAEEVLASVIPVGGLNEALVREISRQTEFVVAVELIIRWRLPDPQTARNLREAWPEYERTEDLAALEHALAAGWALRTAAALDRAGADGGGLRRVFEREVDQRNLLVALRLHEALGRGEIEELPGPSDRSPYLPGGSIRPELLDVAVRLSDSESVAAEIVGAAPENWRAPLERWTRGGDLVALQGELASLWIAEAVTLFYRGDPLGVDVPVAYVIAKDNEARNLRTIAEGAARGLEPYIVRAQLVFPTERSGPG